jgi:heme-degrading monooxygenase HmoA
MYAAIRRYNVFEGAADRITERVNTEFLPRVRELPGFISYFIVDGGDGTMASVTLCESRQGVEESGRMSQEWVKQHLGGLVKTAPVILSGEVRVHAMEGASR